MEREQFHSLELSLQQGQFLSFIDNCEANAFYLNALELIATQQRCELSTREFLTPNSMSLIQPFVILYTMFDKTLTVFITIQVGNG